MAPQLGPLSACNALSSEVRLAQINRHTPTAFSLLGSLLASPLDSRVDSPRDSRVGSQLQGPRDSPHANLLENPRLSLWASQLPTPLPRLPADSPVEAHLANRAVYHSHRPLVPPHPSRLRSPLLRRRLLSPLARHSIPKISLGRPSHRSTSSTFTPLLSSQRAAAL